MFYSSRVISAMNEACVRSCVHAPVSASRGFVRGYNDEAERKQLSEQEK